MSIRANCRAYIEKPEHYHKLLNCCYDNYKNDWGDWSNKPLKNQAIEFYGIQQLVKKLIISINCYNPINDKLT